MSLLDTLTELKPVPIRDIWPNEANDFTPWLAKNIELLFSRLGLDVENITTEENIGRYYADLVADESLTEKKVVVENQLYHTDHDHLGKLITYASLLDAKHIIWLVGAVRAEHQKAIEWLNDLGSDVNFFLVKIDTYRIGDSAPALKFNVVVQPNEEIKAVKRATVAGQGVREINEKHFEFWKGFEHFLFDKETLLKSKFSPKPRNFYDFVTKGLPVRLSISTRPPSLNVAVIFHRKEKLYEWFVSKKSIMLETVNYEVKFDDIPDHVSSKIICTLEGDPHDKDKQQKHYNWLLQRTEELIQAVILVHDEKLKHS